ncbi:MAG: hypothetical protein ACJ75B_13080 [Flavisolibacter sp.]
MKRLAIIFGFVIMIISCSKGNHAEDSWSFQWTHQNLSHIASSADAYQSQAGIGFGPNQLVAFISSTTCNYRLSIRLGSLSPGSTRLPEQDNENHFSN